MKSVDASDENEEKLGGKDDVTHVLAIDPLLAIDLKIPSQSALEELLLLLVGEVELLIRVGLPIRGNIDNGLDVLTTGNQSTTDDGVVGLAEDTHGTEEVLARSLETVEETADLVRGHESLGELFVVLEVHAPQGVPLLVETVSRMASPSTNVHISEKGHALFVEPLKRTSRTTSVLVGVRPLPILEVQGRLRQVIERVLHLGLSGNSRFVIVLGLDLLLLWGFLGLRSLLSLGSFFLLLLLRWGISSSLLAERGLAKD